MANELQTKLDAILADKEANLLPENLKAGTTCLGIAGTLEEGIDTTDATATVDDIASGKTAYVNGELITGTVIEGTEIGDTAETITTLTNADGDHLELNYTKNDGKPAIIFRDGYIMKLNVSYSELANYIGLTADKIKEGETILGITGTYTGETTE